MLASDALGRCRLLWEYYGGMMLNQDARGVMVNRIQGDCLGEVTKALMIGFLAHVVIDERLHKGLPRASRPKFSDWWLPLPSRI